MNNYPFKNHLLIAMPSLNDPNFKQSVAYIYEHNANGALGIVINKPMQITLGDVLRHLTIPIQNIQVNKQPVLLGGPVAQEQGFIILPTANFHSTDAPLAESDQIIVSTSKKVLQALAEEDAPEQAVVSLGYSGWATGQLEKEIANNDWLIAPLDPKILFTLPFEKRWRAAAALIGVDLDRLSSEFGHA